MQVVFSCFISVVFSSYFWFVTVLYICVGCWIFVLFNIPGLYFFLFFNRVTKQDNIFWSFDISLIMSIEESYNWIFSVLIQVMLVTSFFMTRFICRQKFVFFGSLYFFEQGCKIFLKQNLLA